MHKCTVFGDWTLYLTFPVALSRAVIVICNDMLESDAEIESRALVCELGVVYIFSAIYL